MENSKIRGYLSEETAALHPPALDGFIDFQSVIAPLLRDCHGLVYFVALSSLTLP